LGGEGVKRREERRGEERKGREGKRRERKDWILGARAG